MADQLSILGLVPSSKATYAAARQAAADYMQSHPDDFLPFLPSISEDVPGASNDGLMNPQQYTQYCKNVRETAVWGGEPEILALSRAYQVPIHVIQNGVPNIVVHNPLKDAEDRPVDTDRVVRISYHRRMYGLGEVSFRTLYHTASAHISSDSTTTPFDPSEVLPTESKPYSAHRRHHKTVSIVSSSHPRYTYPHGISS